MKISIVLWMLACGAAVSAPAFGDDPLCGGCDTTGKTKNKLAISTMADEAGVVFCSEAMKKDKAACGADEILCTRCKGASYYEDAKRDVESEIERRRAWLEDREKNVDRPVGREFVHIQTEHFILSFDLPSVKVGTVVYRTHAAAHLYAERLEKLYADIREIHELPESRIRAARRYVYIVEGQKAGNILGTLHTNTGAGSRAIQYGNPSHAVITLDKQNFREDADFHQHVAHVVSHLLYNDVDQVQHWLVERYGWVSEGLSHYIEIRYHGAPNTWCHREAGNFVHWKGKDWEANVKKAVLAGQQPSFEELQQKPADALDAKEHQFAWSYIDYLMWLDPTAMPKMIGLMKGPQLPVRECLQSAYGLSIPAFVAGWEQFVKSEYSLTPSKGPKVRPPKRSAPDPRQDEGGDESEDEGGRR